MTERAGIVPPQNLEAEMAVLGGCLLAGEAGLEPLIAEVGLRAEHFYRPSHALVFAAMVTLLDGGDGIDSLTVRNELARTGRLEEVGGAAAVDALAAAPHVVGNLRTYAAPVIETARWRARLTATYQQQMAIADRDEGAYQKAATVADASVPDRAQTLDAAAQGEEFDRWMDSPDEVIPTPWPAINEAFSGGVRRGATTVLAGWTSFGKSVAALDWLQHIAALGGRTALYLNEMSTAEVTARQLAGLANVPFHRLMNPQRLTDLDRKRVRAAYPKLTVFKIRAHGWPWEEIARHVRRNKWDLCCLDLLPQLPGLKDVADYDEAIAGLVNCAGQSNTHLIVVHQLNQGRSGATKPLPALKDLRSSGQIGNNPANVLFVHREQQERAVDGQDDPVVDLMPGGLIQIAKARNGRVGAFERVSFDDAAMTFQVGDAWRGRDQVEAAA